MLTSKSGHKLIVAMGMVIDENDDEKKIDKAEVKTIDEGGLNEYD